MTAFAGFKGSRIRGVKCEERIEKKRGEDRDETEG
jgi:hypothetical protein